MNSSNGKNNRHWQHKPLMRAYFWSCLASLALLLLMWAKPIDALEFMFVPGFVLVAIALGLSMHGDFSLFFVSLAVVLSALFWGIVLMLLLSLLRQVWKG